MFTKRFYAFFISFSSLGASFFAYETALLCRAVYRHVFPDIAVLRVAFPVAVKKEGHKIEYRWQRNRPAHWISLRQVPRQAVAAILMAEDAGFFSHKGYEPEAIRAALEHNMKPGVKIIRGGSTITQQVVKNLFLSPEKTLTRKVRELLLAIELERRFSKGKILETYLNIAEWGPGIYGLEQASRRYFGKPATELSARDAAVLAFMLPNPTKYRYSVRDGELTKFAARRVDTILERMWRRGHISDEEYASSGSSAELPSSL
jgi:monofunctional biosynthetic peptidoglycan transglycosylase